MKEVIAGNVVSKTNWLNMATLMSGYLQMPDTQRLVAKLLSPIMDAEAVEVALAGLTMACALAGIYFRNITVESVAAKGARVLGTGAHP